MVSAIIYSTVFGYLKIILYIWDMGKSYSIVTARDGKNGKVHYKTVSVPESKLTDTQKKSLYELLVFHWNNTPPEIQDVFMKELFAAIKSKKDESQEN